MTAAKDDLDFTGHFNPDYTVPEPRPSEVELKHIDDLGVIGESKLKSSGFYVRMVSAAPSGGPRVPTECTVLVVEDEDGTAFMIEKVLGKAGYHTRRARNRAEISAGLSAKPMPDVILLDVMLPDVNGFYVLNRIRHHAAVKHIPVLMLTWLSERGDIAKGLMHGADGYLTKPALPSTLLDAVQAIIEG